MSSPAEPRHAFQLGQLLVFDILCHNSDRIPCGVFDNDGNPGNLMYSETDGLVPIDNQTTGFAIDTPAAARYLERVQVELGIYCYSKSTLD